jgi:miniconductance mechanosensitive channel
MILSNTVVLADKLFPPIQVLKLVLFHWDLGFIFSLEKVLSLPGRKGAILLLIFKDTILGFVASIQMSVYDMVRVGDWISMPKYDADGDVMSINLTL